MKQISQTNIGLYVYNGEYRAFAGYPKVFKVWNINHIYNADFLSSPVTTALSGRARGNPSGWRASCRINLNNSLASDAQEIRTLLNRTSNQFDRQFYPETGTTTISSVTSTSFVISGAVPTNDYYKGLSVYNVTRNQWRVILTYNVSRVATTTSQQWSNGDNVIVFARPNFSTIIGVSPSTGSAIEYYNLNSGQFGIERELTVGNQIIQLNLEGVERKDIPDVVI